LKALVISPVFSERNRTAMSFIILIQARTNSNRLPAKALLPISGYPMVVLVAKRAANNGAEVVVITSDQPSDDYLVEVLKKHEIEYFRGSLNNPLDRFCRALEFKAHDIIVRLTADNVVPDGKFIQEMVDYFRDQNLGYLTTTGKGSGLPYGVSAEVFIRSDLYEAEQFADTEYDKEHVTPYIKRKYEAQIYKKYESLNKEDVRLTVDSLEDFLRTAELFGKLDSPVHSDFQEIIRLSDTLLCKNTDIPNKRPKLESLMLDKLVLGTAQLGIPYGVTNHSGQPDMHASFHIMMTALKKGIRCFDTAQAYGSSERIIGNFFSTEAYRNTKIVTKLSPLPDLDDQSGKRTVVSAVQNSILWSLYNLRVRNLDALLLHRAEHLETYGGLILSTVRRFKSEGFIDQIGVSIQTPQELERALEYDDIDIIQMPFNILDYRWSNAIASLRREKATRSIEIHVRSVFLQGLLLSSDTEDWRCAGFTNAEELVLAIGHVAEKYKMTRLQTALLPVLTQDWVGSVLVGIADPQQLVEISTAVATAPTKIPSPIAIQDQLKDMAPESLLNPSNWGASG
jgi:spore coat polysaccharide biosynthesis protein SpsF (cytidylyltransferase family)/aryl-alcohol dehydrogenase-like predicted oxidoreductase